MVSKMDHFGQFTVGECELLAIHYVCNCWIADEPVPVLLSIIASWKKCMKAAAMICQAIWRPRMAQKVHQKWKQRLKVKFLLVVIDVIWVSNAGGIVLVFVQLQPSVVNGIENELYCNLHTANIAQPLPIGFYPSNMSGGP